MSQMLPKLIKKFISRFYKGIVFCVVVFAFTLASANPVLNNVASGNVTINQAPGNTVINQKSQQAIINWKSFNINANEKTQFIQPNSNAIALNRIDPSQGASQIFGELLANGKIILVNQAGIFFGSGAQINVGSLIASTSNISSANFLSGNYIFNSPSPYAGSIINQGTIITANYGLAALVGTSVVNSGVIEANFGNIVLASGSKFTFDLSGDQLINFSVDAPASSAGVDANGNTLTNSISNSGSLIANDGNIYLTAKAASNVIDSDINMSGIAEATSVTSKGGDIILSGNGTVTVSGMLDVNGAAGGVVKVLGQHIHLTSTADIEANGTQGGGQILIGGDEHGTGPDPDALTTSIDLDAVLNANATASGNGGQITVWSNDNTAFNGSISAEGGAQSGNGGFVETSGAVLDITNVSVNLTAPHGATGTWLLDPSTLDVDNCSSCGTIISGQNDSTSTEINYQTVDDALATANLILNADTNITITNGISWSSANTLTLSTNDSGSIININNSISGVNGGLIINTAGSSDSIITSNAGAITVNTFILQSGAWTQVVGQNSLTSLPTFTSPQDFEIQGGTFLRAAGGDGTSTVTPYLITDIYGLQGMGGFLNSDFALNNNVDATVTSNWNSGSGFAPIGTVINPFNGTFDGQNNIINNYYSNVNGLFSATTSNAVIENIIMQNGDVNLTALTAQADVGLLVGNNLGSITSASALSSTVFTPDSSGSNPDDIGGLVGYNDGAMTDASYQGSVSSQALSTTGPSAIGGLVGYNDVSGVIMQSYASGTISNEATSGQEMVGGLVGYNNGALTYTNFSGNVTNDDQGSGGQEKVGGLVGTNDVNGNIIDSYDTGNINSIQSAGDVYVGGLVADNFGSISLSYSASNITSSDSGNGYNSVGGFVGYNESSGSIIDTYSIGNVTNYDIVGNDFVGSFIGFNNGSVSYSYSTGALNINDPNAMGYYGGFIGYNNGFGFSVSNDFFDTGTTNSSNACGAGACFQVTGGTFNGSSGADLSSISTYSGWDITDQPSTTNAAPINAWFIFDGTYTSGFTRPILLMEFSTTITNAHQLQLAGTALDADYTLANDIDLTSAMTNAADIWGTDTNTTTGAGFVPIGSASSTATYFAGNFNGQNYTISNLYENTTVDAGLFGVVSNSSANIFENIGLVNANITSSGPEVGILIGSVGAPYSSFGGPSILNDYSTGNVTNTSSIGGDTGGLVGYANGSYISESYSGANVLVTTMGAAFNEGGLVGNLGDACNGSCGDGSNNNLISNSYSYGNVTTTGSGTSLDFANIGGLLGTSQAGGGTVEYSYSSGYVSASDTASNYYIGGLVGSNPSGNTVQDSFWDLNATGQANGIGNNTGTASNVIGSTTAEMMTLNNYNGLGWMITASSSATPNDAVWFLVNGYTRPILLSEEFYDNSPLPIQNGHQLELMNADLSASYTLENNIDLTSSLSNYSDIWGTSSETGSGFAPIGTIGASFTGIFNGNYYNINDLYINQSNNSYLGLFGQTDGATISNVNVTNAIIIGNDDIGALVGNTIDSTIQNTSSTGTIIGGADTANGVGGLIGDMSSGTLQTSYSAVDVTGSNMLAGLIGQVAQGSVMDVYSIGSVTGFAENATGDIGGLIGYVGSSATISDAYSTGFVSTNALGGHTGGFIGDNKGTVTNSFWDIDTSGQTVGIAADNMSGVTGATFDGTNSGSLAAFQTYYQSGSGWNISDTISTTSTAPSSVWFIFNGETRPILMMEYNTTISNAHQLQLAASTLGASYTLANNIDLTSAMNNEADIWGSDASANVGAGFVPIGNSTQPFSGSFNGNNYIINALYINQPTNDDVGLFGNVNTTGSIESLGVTNENITGGNVVGGLVGNMTYGIINDTYVTGTITQTSANSYFGAGGLIGVLESEGVVNDSYSAVNVIGVSDLGGFVGLNDSLIMNAYAIGNVTTATSNDVGGFVGSNNGYINDVYSTGIPTNSDGISDGLSAINNGTITNSFWDETTSGTTNSNGGYGMTSANMMSLSNYDSGTSANGGPDPNWNITGTVSTTSAPDTTWFIFDGDTRPILMMEYSTSITNAHQLELAGTTLDANYTLENNIDLTSAMNNPQDIWDASANTAGGFLPIASNGSPTFSGMFNGQGYSINGLYINRPGTNDIGLFGQSIGTINNVSVTNANIVGDDYVGALVGDVEGGLIENSYATGTVTGGSGLSNGAGGLIGFLNGNAVLATSYSAVNVSGSNLLGGLVGQLNEGTVIDSYSIGSVTANTTSDIGGLIGLVGASGVVTNTYSSGLVTTTISGSGTVGGFIGDNQGTVTNSFWDTNTSDQAIGIGADNMSGVTGSTFNSDSAGSLAAYATYSSIWNISDTPSTGEAPDSIWFIFNGQTRPILMMEYNSTISNAHQLQLAGTTLNGYYTLANNIDLTSAMTNASDIWGTDTNTNTGTGFVPIGDNATSSYNFNGIFNGNNHTINDLYVNLPTDDWVGLFGSVAGNAYIENLGVTNVNLTGGQNVGGFVGAVNSSSATIIDSYSTGSVIQSYVSSSYGVGGFVGSLNEGTIYDSYTETNVVGVGSIGGFVGYNGGLIADAYATGDVTAINMANTGGFVGLANGGAINNAYSSGISANMNGYSNGFTGYSEGTNITNSYWDTTTSESTTDPAATGLSISQMMSSGNFSDWNITSTPSDTATPPSTTWFIFNGSTTPLLMMEYSTDISNAHQLQLAGSTLGAGYTLANNIDLTSSMNNAGDVWGAETANSAGFAPIGTSSAPFTGTFNGENYIINGLYINKPSTEYIGLFGQSTGSISDVGLTNVNIIGSDAVGALVGDVTGGSIQNTFATGSVIGDSSSLSFGVGGLIGYMNGGSLQTSYSGVDVTGTNLAGGLIGYLNQGSVADAYSIGSVFGESTTDIGGLIGLTSSGTTVTQTYSTGLVLTIGTGTNTVGGFIGDNLGTVSESFWDTSSSGKSTGIGAGHVSGATGSTFSSSLDQLNTYANWNISDTVSLSSIAPTSTWFIFNGESRPILMMEYDTTISTPQQLQLAASTLGANYTLANNIDLSTSLSNASDIWGGSSAGFIPIGTSSGQPFSGSFNGEGYVINGLMINRSSANLGLFGYVISPDTLQNVGFTNATITGDYAIGTLAGYVDGDPTITNVYASDSTLTGTAYNSDEGVGGLIGVMNSGSLSNAYSDSTIQANGNAGGLVGDVDNNSVTINTSYSAGSVTGGTSGGGNVGGLVGLLQGQVTNAYSIATVTASGSSVNAGGFIGYLDTGASVTNTYSSGLVINNGSGDTIGGFIGLNSAGSILASFWDTGSSNQVHGVGSGSSTNLVSDTFSALDQYSTYSSIWNISDTPNSNGAPSTTWFIFNGNTRPILMMEYQANITNAHALQLAGTDLSGSYTLANNIDASGTTNNADIWGGSYGSGFVPIGNASTFSGNFNGNNYTINNLNINTATDAALFDNVNYNANSYGYIENVGLTNATITSTGSSAAGIAITANGGLILQNVSVSGSITSDTGSAAGLVTTFTEGELIDSYNLSTVTGNGSSTNLVGGLVGDLGSSATILDSYNSGNVTFAGTSGYAGGIAGQMNGTFTNVYNIGDVTNTDGTAAGGLVGLMDAGNISNSYDSGVVQGALTGGIIGSYNNGYINDAFWDAGVSASQTTNGIGNSSVPSNGSYIFAGCFGNTNCVATITHASNNQNSLVNLAQIASYLDSGNGWGNITDSPTSTPGYAPSDAWYIFENGTRPILLMEYSTTITDAHQLQLISVAPGASYTLANNIDLTSGMTNKSDIWDTDTNTSSGNGFVPIAYNGTFSGSFNGNDYVINDLYINLSAQNLGLFSYVNTDYSISQVGLSNATVTGQIGLGALVAELSNGTIDHDYSSNGNITGDTSGSNDGVGGLIGVINGNAIVYDSFSIGSVTSAGDAGGFVSDVTNNALIDEAFSSGTVTSSGNGYNLGGFIGNLSNGTILNSYNTAEVVNTNSSISGGFAGSLSGAVTDSYSTGYMIGGGYGFVGDNNGTITASFWDTGTSGTFTGYSGNNPGSQLVGSTFAISLSTLSTFTAAGWNIAAGSVAGDTWGIVNGYSYPYLTAFYPTTPRAISGLVASATQYVAIQLYDNSNPISSEVSNGVISQGVATLGANDFYYFLEGNNVIPNASTVTIKTTTSPVLTTSISAPASDGSIINLDILNGFTITGSVPAGTDTNSTIELVYDGTVLDSYNFTDTVTDTYSFFVPLAYLNGDQQYLLYLSGANTYSNTLFSETATAGNLSGINLVANTLSIFAGNSLTYITNTSLHAATEGLSPVTPSNILFSTAANGNGGYDLTLGNATHNTVNFVTSSGTTYELDGAISPYTSGTPTITFNGPTLLEYSAAVTGASLTFNAINGNGNSLTLSNTDNLSSLKGIFSGTGSSLIYDGLGELTLDASNTYTGSTTISSGTIFENHVTSLPDTSLTINGTLDLNSYFQTFTYVSGSGNVTNTNATEAKLTIDNSIMDNYAGSISGFTEFDAVGSAEIILSGSNTNTGYDIVLSNTLGIQNTQALGNSTDYPYLVSLSPGTNLDFNFPVNGTTLAASASQEFDLSGSNTITISGTNDTINDKIILSGNNSNVIGGTGTGTFGGVISGGYNLTISGGGTITFGSANTYTGTTSITGGELIVSQLQVLSSASSLGDATSTISISNGAILSDSAVTDSTSRAFSIGSGGGEIQATDPNASLTLSGGITDASSVTFDDINSGDILIATNGISGAGGVIKTSSGTLTFNTDDENTYTGTTQVDGGTLTVLNANGLGSDSDYSSAISVESGATLNFSMSGDTLAADASSQIITLDGGSLTFSSDNDVVNDAISLTSNSTIGGSAAGTLGGVISGISYSLTMSGSSTITLTGANSYTGGTIISSGTLQVDDGGTTGSLGTGGVIDNSVLIYDRSDTITDSNAISGSGTLTQNGGGTLILTGNNSYSDGTTINSGTLQVGDDSTTGSLGTGGVTDDGALVYDRSNSITDDNAISGSGSLTQSGSGTLILGSTESYSGTTTINDGTLQLGVANAIPITSAVTVGTNGTLDLNSNSDSIGSIAGAGALDIETATLTTGNDNTDTEFDGIITGSSGGITKNGTGTFTVTNSNNSYSGSTIINDGTYTITAVNAIPSTSALTIGATVTFELGFSQSLSGINGSGILNLSNDSTLTIIGSSNNAFSGSLTGSGNLVMASSGEQTLSGANNTYSGTTDVQDGILNFASNETLSGVSVESGAELMLSGTTLTSSLTLDGGTLISTTAASAMLTGNITLSGAGNVITANQSSGTLTVNGNIDGASDLTLNGVNELIITGTIGNNTSLTSLTSSLSNNSILQINGGLVKTTHNQAYNNPVNVTTTTLFDSTSGAIGMNSTLDGAVDVTFDSLGTTTLGNAVGSGTILNSLTSDASVTAINGGIVNTTGSQVYNSAVSLGNDAILTSNGGVITFGNGISGGKNLTLNTSSVDESFNLSGSLQVNNLTVNGVLGNNTLTVTPLVSDYLTWTATSNDNGTITGAREMSGAFNFYNIESIANNGPSTLSVPIITTDVYITGSTIPHGPISGYFDDPVYFSGFTTLSTISTGPIPVYFEGIPVVFNPANDTFSVNGTTLSFDNFRAFYFNGFTFAPVLGSTPTTPNLDIITPTAPSSSPDNSQVSSVPSPSAIMEQSDNNISYISDNTLEMMETEDDLSNQPPEKETNDYCQLSEYALAVQQLDEGTLSYCPR